MTTMQTAHKLNRHPDHHSLSIGLARGEGDIRAAQKLRYSVFCDELGARLPTRTPGVDQDIYDPFCEHLIVRDETDGEVVGTYRILSPENARRVGGYYSENEFDLTRLQHLRPRLVEVGRSCVHADYRNGATIALLWSGLAQYMRERGHEYLFGCASMSMADGGYAATYHYSQLSAYLSPLEYRVFARCPLPMAALQSQVSRENAPKLPPLIKGYLRLGAYICGDPAWDPDFNTADLPVLLPITRLEGRYARHFMEKRD